MSENASNGEAVATEASVETPEAGTEPTTANTKTPEWYETELKKVRDEAASNRVKGNEKANAAKAEVTAEFEAKLAEADNAHKSTKTELAKAQLIVEKASVALDAVLGEEKAARVRAFARTLQGTNADELKAHAEELTKLFGPAQSKAVDRTQGLGSGNKAGSGGDEFSSFMVNLFDNK